MACLFWDFPPAEAGRMYMAPDPHDVLYENLAEDDINASSWKWLGHLE